MPLLSLPEAKESLSLTANTFDDELADYLRGIEEVITYLCGPTDQVSVTETVSGRGTIVLKVCPVLSVTSITGSAGTALLTPEFRVDLDSGVVYNQPGYPLYPDWYTVSYVAGRSDIPAGLRTAARVILKHVWMTQRGAGSRRSTGGDDATLVPGYGYAVPHRAMTFMAPYLLGPSVA